MSDHANFGDTGRPLSRSLLLSRRFESADLKFPRIGSTRLVILGGLAELFSGAISMGLGAYLAAKTEAKTYEVEELRERREVEEMPEAEEEEIYEIFDEYNLPRETVRPLVETLRRDKDMWVKVGLHIRFISSKL